MLSKINNKIGGKQEHSEITVTTYYPGGRSRGGSVEAPTPQVDNSRPTISQRSIGNHIYISFSIESIS